MSADTGHELPSDIPLNHPEFTVKIGPNTLSLADIVVPNDPESRRLNIVEQRTDACHRLYDLTNTDFSGWRDKALNIALIAIYGYDQTEVSLLPEIERQRMFRELVGRDLLLREMLDGDGEPSRFALSNYHNRIINPNEYLMCGISWPGALEKIESLIPDDQTDDSIGYVKDEPQITDPIERYAQLHGPESIIALPFSITVEDDKISIEFDPEFSPPYGGDPDQERLVFLPVGDNYSPKATSDTD